MKNIVLFSDGTGNGAAKRHQTNVWRLYRALDLQRKDQIAFYDDGVGSQEFLPFKILGGVFGLGLHRNIVELYKFLCRNYEPGDKIYLFGFSRGAFTVRMLAGLIAHCGVYTGSNSEAELNKAAEERYSAFRDKFKHGYLSRGIGWLVKGVRAILGKKPVECKVTDNEIEFIGVWDTVDAYGLPIDELAMLWDWLIFPIRFPDQRLSTQVKRACHAMSIDDERLTFHPLLWDESTEAGLAADKKVAANRIEQVWFSGVHSDVGGGYAMNDLSLVPLDWMMDRVGAQETTGPGLHFIADVRDEYQIHADWDGMQHDSRAGLAAYYRYKPREIDQLCNDRRAWDKEKWVIVEKPKIHRGALERIRDNTVPYAPTGLPEIYQVAVTRGDVPVIETPAQATERALAMNHALDVNFWRRWLYIALLATTFALVTSRFFLGWTEDGICKGTACALDPLLEFGKDYLPDFAAGWFEALRQNPGWLWGFIAVFTVLTLLKVCFTAMTRSLARDAWAELKKLSRERKAWHETLTSELRQWLRTPELREVVRWSTAGIAFVLVLYVLVALVSRATYFVRSTTGSFCESAQTAPLDKPKTVKFNVENPCFATKIALKEGVTYRFEATGEDWTDGTIPAGPDGFDTPDDGSEAPKLSMSVPFRRHFSVPWFRLMGRIDDAGKEDFEIGSGPAIYTAKSDGELFLYVNDAVFSFRFGRNWALPYFWPQGPNVGVARVTVSRANCVVGCPAPVRD